MYITLINVTWEMAGSLLQLRSLFLKFTDFSPCVTWWKVEGFKHDEREDDVELIAEARCGRSATIYHDPFFRPEESRCVQFPCAMMPEQHSGNRSVLAVTRAATIHPSIHRSDRPSLTISSTARNFRNDRPRPFGVVVSRLLMRAKDAVLLLPASFCAFWETCASSI